MCVTPLSLHDYHIFGTETTDGCLQPGVLESFDLFLTVVLQDLKDFPDASFRKVFFSLSGWANKWLLIEKKLLYIYYLLLAVAHMVLHQMMQYLTRISLRSKICNKVDIEYQILDSVK